MSREPLVWPTDFSRKVRNDGLAEKWSKKGPKSGKKWSKSGENAEKWSKSGPGGGGLGPGEKGFRAVVAKVAKMPLLRHFWPLLVIF